MKNIFVLIIFCITHANIISAQEIPLATQEQFQAFKKSTTYFVTYDDPFSSFNAYMKEAVEKLWIITPYKIISPEEFESLSKSKSNSFVFLSEAAFSQGNVNMTFNILNIVLGNTSGDINRMPDLGSAPLSYASPDEDEEEYLYKIGIIIHFFQYYIQYNINNPGTDIKAMVKANEDDLKGKELWLVKEDMADDVNSVEEIESYYDGNIKFVTKEDIKTAILNKTEGIAIVHKVGPLSGGDGSRCLKFIILVSNGEPLYYDMTVVSNAKPPKFLSSDFKALK